MSMHLLVTWGSKRGGTEGIAAVVAEALRMRGYEVTEQPANKAPPPDAFDGVIVGGALYANRWHRAARRYVNRYAKSLRKRPLWLFSSGPLDDAAAKQEIPPTTQVGVLMQRTGAIAHATFGGRLEADAKGFPASAMAKQHAGDWRDLERVRAWSNDIADHLFGASPGYASDPPGWAVPRLVEHGLVGAIACAAVFATMLVLASTRAAFVVQAVFAPLVFTLIANHYFAARGARQPAPTALAFAGLTAAFELAVVAGLSVPWVATSWIGFYVPLFAIFVVTWAIGAVRSMLPFPTARVL